MQRFKGMVVEDNYSGPYCLYDQAKQEIESLRFTIEALTAGKAYYAELAAEQIKRGDEWKWLLRQTLDWIKDPDDCGCPDMWKHYLTDYPEAASWFEEE